jgi:hypothetical protein
MKKLIDLMTRKEVQDYLHITDVSVWNWEKRGWLKPIALGKKIYYKQEDILSLLEKGYTNNDEA